MRVISIVLALSFLGASALAAPPQRAVLVTGASTGIGRAAAERLAKEGFFVYAGARKDADLEALSKIPNMQGIRLDVTKASDVAAAVKTVKDAGRGLYAIVNNAGVAVAGPLIELSEDDLRYQMDVNVIGPWRVTKAFAPLVIESKGRITTTGSISGFIGWPMGGAYVMSKHAVEGYTEVLAAELEPFGVQVSVVEPGNYRSEICKGVRQRLLDGGYGGEGSLYKKQIELMAAIEDRNDEKEPDEVADAILHALTDEHPKRRYLVVPNPREAEWTLAAAMQRVVQLNDRQPYARDRDGLVALLDRALGAGGAAGEGDDDDDDEASAKAITKLDDDWSAAAVARDVERVASFYADDAIAYPPNEPVALGKNAARAVWARFFEIPSFEISWKTTHAQVTGDLGFTSGTYTDSFKGDDGALVKEQGKYLCVWKRQADGSWKAIHDMWNTDAK